MTAHDEFNRMFSDWLDEQAGRGAPDYLDGILARTTRTRQRPAWSSLERWLPVQLTFTGRLAPIPRPVWIVALLATLVLAAAALFAGAIAQRRLPHFGAAANGAIALIDGGSLKIANTDGTNVRTVASLPNGAEELSFSPDGTRLAYETTGPIPAIIVADADGSHPIAVASGPAVATGMPIAWSADGRRLAFTSLLAANTIGTIDTVDADGSHLRQVITGPAAEAVDRFAPAWSPDGQWIAFFSTGVSNDVVLNVIHPDGSGPKTLKTSPADPDLAKLAWSPDPAQSRLLYVATAGRYVTLYDLSTETETTVDSGFWPSWSPDGRMVTWWNFGTNVASVADVLANQLRPTMVFPMVPGARCQDNPDLAGKAICAPAQ
jgi:Tol biopolymer transport system component